MLSKTIEDALNEQVNAELWSAYLYLAMAHNFEADGKSGIANWFKVQFKEEQAHAEIFMNYINARGGRVWLKPIDAVETEWATPLDAFNATRSVKMSDEGKLLLMDGDGNEIMTLARK